MSSLLRKSHFLGAKFRNLRKRNGLTLQDLSTRCIQIDADLAPSVSYLSMIETGQRIPSPPLLDLLASVFQKDAHWFLDENPEIEATPRDKVKGGAARIPLEPGFLFSRELLEAAIPELLAQTGTTGQQFAHLLIRSYQEMAQNDFPDLERSAEEVGERRFPLTVDDLLRPVQTPRREDPLVRPQATARPRQRARSTQHGPLVFRGTVASSTSIANCRRIRPASSSIWPPIWRTRSCMAETG